MLVDEGRYNEAYKIAQISGHNSLLQNVCEKASVYYFSVGDLESAYVYASGAPEPFPEMIIDYAAQSVISLSTGEINESAFRVAKMSTDNATFDAIIHTMCESLISAGDYSNALRIVTELRNSTDRLDTEWEIFRAGLNAYLTAHDYNRIIAYIEDLFALDSFDYSDAQIVNALLNECSQLGDLAGVIYFADRYPALAEISASQAAVSMAASSSVKVEYFSLTTTMTPSLCLISGKASATTLRGVVSKMM